MKLAHQYSLMACFLAQVCMRQADLIKAYMEHCLTHAVLISAQMAEPFSLVSSTSPNATAVLTLMTGALCRKNYFKTFWKTD